MLSMKISDVVASIVDQELGKGREKEALLFQFDCSLSYWEKKSHDARCGLHLLYHREPYSTYISVFSTVTDSPFDKLKEAVWNHECTHDSCWRDIEIFSKVYFDLARKVNALMNESTNVAPAEMSQHNYSNRFSTGLYSWVPVEVSMDPEDKWNYRKLIKILWDRK